MKKITVNASKKYNILIENGILPCSGNYISEVFGSGKTACIVTDDNIAPLYLAEVGTSLKSSGFTVINYIIPHGEISKSLAVLSNLLEFFAECSLTRTDFLVALGGGVVGDLCGFAAAVYLRGIRFVQIPTTLLAMVDSSVGGKTGVDLAAGKNLAGAFHQPSLVICDPKTLVTLTPETFTDGCAEIIKYGMINDAALFEALKKDISDNLEDIIFACVRDKADIVEQDEFDTGKRQLLNLGHTVGHAVEILSEYGISHGSAVAIGMVLITRAAVRLGICPENDLNSLIFLLKSYRLPTECMYAAKELAASAMGDKKRAGGNITLVVPEGIGNSVLKSIPVTELEAFFTKGL